MLARTFVFSAIASVCCSAAASQSGSSYAAPYSSSRAGQDSSAAAQTTVNLLVGPGVANDHFAASVVNADACTTTYALACTSGIYEIGSQYASCDPAWMFLGTYAPNSYRTLAKAEFGAYTGIDLIECSVDATVSAVCTASASAELNGYRTSSSTTYTLTGGELAYKQVPVTAGAALLSPPGACTTSANAAAPTALIDVYKVLVVPGMVGLIGAVV